MKHTLFTPPLEMQKCFQEKLNPRFKRPTGRPVNSRLQKKETQ